MDYISKIRYIKENIVKVAFDYESEFKGDERSE